MGQEANNQRPNHMRHQGRTQRTEQKRAITLAARIVRKLPLLHNAILGMGKEEKCIIKIRLIMPMFKKFGGNKYSHVILPGVNYYKLFGWTFITKEM